MKIMWDQVPSHVRRDVAPYLKRFAPLLPTWIERVHVSYGSSEDPKDFATCELDHEYRAFYVTFHERFFTLDKNMKALTIIHEFLHIAYGPVSKVFDNLLNSCLEPDDPLAVFAQEEWRKGEESGVSDLEYGIGRLLGIHFTDTFSRG